METFESIDAWQRQTFGIAELPLSTMPKKLQEEWEELQLRLEEARRAGWSAPARQRVAEEAVDLAIVALAVVRAAGCAPQELVDAKMALNRRRRWKRQANGTFHHVTDHTLEVS